MGCAAQEEREVMAQPAAQAQISQTQLTVDLLSQAASGVEDVLNSMGHEAAEAAKAGEHQILQLIAEDIQAVSMAAQQLLEHRERAIRRTGNGN